MLLPGAMWFAMRMASASSEDVRYEVRPRKRRAIVGMASPRLAVYTSAPSDGLSSGVAGFTGAMLALTGCNWACFAVWAWAVKSENECGPKRQAAAAKSKQLRAQITRTDERRKSSSEPTCMRY